MANLNADEPDLHSKTSKEFDVPTPVHEPDVEAEAATEKQPTSPELPRHPREGIPTWQWILSLVGLYMGALLYGTLISIPRYKSLTTSRPGYDNCGRCAGRSLRKPGRDSEFTMGWAGFPNGVCSHNSADRTAVCAIQPQVVADCQHYHLRNRQRNLRCGS
jgi:hypothetical protein